MRLTFLHVITLCITYGSRDCLGIEVLPLVMAMVISVISFSLPKAGFYYEVNYHVSHLLINRQLGLRWWLYNLLG